MYTMCEIRICEHQDSFSNTFFINFIFFNSSLIVAKFGLKRKKSESIYLFGTFFSVNLIQFFFRIQKFKEQMEGIQELIK